MGHVKYMNRWVMRMKLFLLMMLMIINRIKKCQFKILDHNKKLLKSLILKRNKL